MRSAVPMPQPGRGGAGAPALPVAARGPSRGLTHALAAFCVIAVARVQDVLPAVQKLPLAKLVVLAMVPLALASMPRELWRSAFRHKAVRAYLVILVLAVLSVPTSFWAGQSVEMLRVQILPATVMFLIAVPGFLDRSTLRRVIYIVTAAIVVSALYLVLFGVPWGNSGRVGMGSLDPNDTAVLFVASLPFTLMLASEPGARSKLWYLGSLLCVAATVKTGSRGGFLAIMATAVCLVCFAPPHRRTTFIFGLVAGTIVFGATATGKIRERLMTTFSLSKSGDYNLDTQDGRIEVWKRGFGYMLRRPLLGVGVGAFGTAEGTTEFSGKQNVGFGLKYSAAHNSFVQIGAELGVIGLACFLVMLGTTARGCWRVRRLAGKLQRTVPSLASSEGALAGAALASMVGMTTAITFLSFAYHPITLFFLALGIGIGAASPLYRVATHPGGAMATAPQRPPMRGAPVPRRGPVPAGAPLPPPYGAVQPARGSRAPGGWPGGRR